MNLSQHFTLEEFTFSQTAARLGIDNTPSASVVGNLTVLASTLERIRTLLGRPITITSGYRCPDLNKAAGGAVNSAHKEGLAADIKVAGLTPKQVCEAIRDSGIEFDQVIHEFQSWCHIGLTRGKARNECLTIDKLGTRRGIV